jgi:ribonucleoside-triphosphate reductase
MRVAKSGAWWEHNVQRALANNSVAYTETPDIGIFMDEWKSLYDSKSGERGIFNRQAAIDLLPERRQEAGYKDFGTNPCSEIVLRSKQFCNLSTVIIKSTDSFEDLKEKVEIAAFLGTLQATLTDFRYLSKEWKRNTEEEALLGVSLTGIMDHKVLNGTPCENGFALESWLIGLKNDAVATNRYWADVLGINPASAVTCVKPEGTVSQLTDTASGIHPRYAPYYIRTIRADKKDPLAQFLIEKGIYVEDDVTKPETTVVFSFPMKAPDGSVFRDDRSAIEQLELWKTYQLNWCEHKPSITVYVKEHEWMQVGAWVYENFGILSGVSFLPHSNHSYRQAPYQEITKEEYDSWVERYKDIEINWEELSNYEKEDYTIGSQEYACVSGACEII